MTQTLVVRLRDPLDLVPEKLMEGNLEALKLDYNWQWVVEHEGEIVAQVLCSPCHGLIHILRISSMPEAPHGWAVVALRRVLSDAKARGMIGFMTLLADKQPAEVKLMKIIQRQGGQLVPFYGALAFGSTENGY